MAKLLDLPERVLLGWLRYYGEEPWDAPAQAVIAFGRRCAKPVSGDDPEGLEEAFRRFAGGA